MVSVTVAIPSSVLEVEPGLLLKTLRVHQIIRYSSIYGVSRIALYKDPFTSPGAHERYVQLFGKLHRYLLTPPYLRRKLIPLDPDLRYVGLLDPLRLKAYNVSKHGVVGEIRIGLLEGSRVDVGLKELFILENPSECTSIKNGMVIVELTSLNPPTAKCVDFKPYMGPELEVYASLTEVVDEYAEKHGEKTLILATSRFGRVPSIKTLTELSKQDSILVLFGAPRYGLYEIARAEGFNLEDRVADVWNTIPGQCVKTVRTEEALIATLAIINMYARTRSG